MAEYNPIIDAPFVPMGKTEPSGIELLQEKVKNGDELDDKERRVVNIALRAARNLLYDKQPYIPFICGEGGEKGDDEMPEFFFICPNYGLDGFAVYKKDKDYDGPGW
jgi:hypothetical protein